MRIERFDIDNYGCLATSFQFTSSGLALWGSPNATGKSTLVRAIADTLYGSPPSNPRISSDRPCTARLIVMLDSGERRVIDRNFTDAEFRVSSDDGTDLTSDFYEGDRRLQPGQVFLGLSRSQFLEVCAVRFEELRETPANGALLQLLCHGRDSGRPDSQLDEAPAPPLPAPELDETPDATAEPLQIESAAEDIEIISSVGDMFLGSMPDVDATEIEPAAAETSAASQALEPTEGVETSKLRELQARVEELDAELASRRHDLEMHASQAAEQFAASKRLENLSGAEPEDVDRMKSVLEEIQVAESEQEATRRELSDFEESLNSRGLSADSLVALDSNLSSLEEAERRFVEGFQETEAVQRGNLAIVRSEGRLQETELTELEASEKKTARWSLLPLSVAALLLLAAAVAPFLPLPSWAGWVGTVSGLVTAAGAGGLLGYAKWARQARKTELQKSIAEKKQSVAELEKDGKYRAARIGILADERGFGSPGELVEGFSQWSTFETELRFLEDVKQREAEAEARVTRLREKLTTFQAPAGDEDGIEIMGSFPDMNAAPNPTASDSLVMDYQQFFGMKEEMARTGEMVERIEEDLACLERERAAVEKNIRTALEAAGIDADRDRAEAIEMYALRARVGQSNEVEVEVDATTERRDEANFDWISALSARTEAIVRRFLPNAREVEITEQLVPTLKLGPREPRISPREMERELSGASLDQVCLALRLAIVETLSAQGERIPLILDDPLVRLDDSTYDQALDFLVAEASERAQVVLLTAQEVRTRWFLHQFPQHQDRLFAIGAEDSAAETEPSPSSSASS